MKFEIGDKVVLDSNLINNDQHRHKGIVFDRIMEVEDTCNAKSGQIILVRDALGSGDWLSSIYFKKYIEEIDIDALLAEIHILCQNVSKGAKLLADKFFQKKDDSDYVKIIDAVTKWDGLKCLISHSDDSKWVTIYIYKYDLVKELIDEIDLLPDGKLKHFINGKMYGYSDNEIMNFIDSEGRS